jgi:hypothetical protein
MKQKPPYTIHTDPRNAVVTGEAVLVIGPGRVSFHGKAKDLDSQAIADAWALAGALRDGDDAPTAPDVAALQEKLGQVQRLLVYHLCDCGRDVPPEPHLHAVDCRYRRAVESVEANS